MNEVAGRQTHPINQLHADMESLIEERGLEWTILRANTIASNARGWAGQIHRSGVVRSPDIAPTEVIDQRDVAAVAAQVLPHDWYSGAKLVPTERGARAAAMPESPARYTRGHRGYMSGLSHSNQVARTCSSTFPGARWGAACGVAGRAAERASAVG